MAINMKPNAFYNRKKANSVPLSEFVILANTYNLCIDWLVFGIGPIYKDAKSESIHQSTESENTTRSVTVHRQQKPDDPSGQPPVTELITKTIEILESKTVYSSALSANIQAFHEATRAEQKFQELQANTEKRFKEMESRITALETENNKLREQIKNTPGNDDRMAANEG